AASARLARQPGRLAWCLPLVGRSVAVERLAHRARHEDAREFTLVGGRAAHVRDALAFVGGGIARARESPLIAGRGRQRAFAVLPLPTTRADLTIALSASSATAPPSAGQSSAEPVVTLRKAARDRLCAGMRSSAISSFLASTVSK